MLKTVILLPDGRELSSGVGTVDAIKSATFTQCVNDETELTLGSVCANMLQAEIITPAGGLTLQAGQEITVFRQQGAVRHAMGMYTLEEPVRTGANTLSITAYDRVSWLDKDLTQWLAQLQGWPYRLYDLLELVCVQCGLQLKNETIPNGDFLVQAFTAQGITGRQLVKWAAAVAGRFCRATEDGQLELAWYTPAPYALGPVEASFAEGNLTLTGVTGSYQEENLTLGATAVTEGENLTLTLPQRLTYFMGGLSYEDYAVAPIEKVQVKLTREDVGAVYPDTQTPCNTYVLSGNYLLTSALAENLETIAQSLYEQLKDLTYTPCTVTMPADPRIRAGQILAVTDPNGKTFAAYIMTKTQTGQTDTLECTGSYCRDSVWAMNQASYKALSGKVLELRADVEGIRAENRDAAGNLASVQMDLQGITTEVTHQQTVTEGLLTRTAAVEQTAQGLSVQIGSIRSDGVSKVITSRKQYTLSDAGLDISSEGDEIGNRIDHQGMCVSRGSTPVLKATAAGVEAIDITVHNYLVAGSHARLEDYTDGTDPNRTACFFL